MRGGRAPAPRREGGIGRRRDLPGRPPRTCDPGAARGAGPGARTQLGLRASGARHPPRQTQYPAPVRTQSQLAARARAHGRGPSGSLPSRPAARGTQWGSQMGGVGSTVEAKSWPPHWRRVTGSPLHPVGFKPRAPTWLDTRPAQGAGLRTTELSTPGQPRAPRRSVEIAFRAGPHLPNPRESRWRWGREALERSQSWDWGSRSRSRSPP